MKNHLPCFATAVARSYTRMTSAAADVQQEEFRTIKRKPWLLGITSQEKKQLGIISMLVVYIKVLHYSLVFIIVIVLVVELLKQETQVSQFEQEIYRLQ